MSRPRASCLPSKRFARLVFVALGATSSVSLAAEGDAAATAETACVLPHFSGKIVMRVPPGDCPSGRSCRALALEDASGRRVFGVEAAMDGDVPALACDAGFVVLRWLGQELRFDFHAGALRLAPDDRRRVAGSWQAPAARTENGFEAHAHLADLLMLARAGLHDGRAPPAGLDEELVGLVELAMVKDRVRSGAFQLADDLLTDFERAQSPSAPPAGRLPRELWVHVVELRHELDDARRRSLPFSLGPRRFVGGAERMLETPLDVERAPELFFRGAELCVVDVAPESRPFEPSAAEWPEDRMRCFVPSATSAAESEPRASPASAAANLAHLDASSAWNRCRSSTLVSQKPFPDDANTCEGGPVVALDHLLAVVDGDAMLAVSHGELELVRSATVTETISPAHARELVAGSAGTRLFAGTASYFLDARRLVQVAGAETRTWRLLGEPPKGTAWVGVPLVSPDQRWVVAQSAAGLHAPVSLWVFPIVR
ncbi:MAG TPA: hypothetical protein VMI54_13375 [Polyangiaceae bacterium]|nr:hypothetical protein [Polyangiaceae bacterium]